LLGKACGLYRDVIEDNRERPSTLVAAELEARLASLLPQVPQQQVPTEQVPVEQRVNGVIDQHDAAGSSLSH
jgi:hypothetical protein